MFVLIEVQLLNRDVQNGLARKIWIRYFWLIWLCQITFWLVTNQWLGKVMRQVLSDKTRKSGKPRNDFKNEFQTSDLHKKIKLKFSRTPCDIDRKVNANGISDGDQIRITRKSSSGKPCLKFKLRISGWERSQSLNTPEVFVKCNSAEWRQMMFQ